MHSLYPSRVVSLEIAKVKKLFTDGSLVKRCAIEIAKAFEDVKLAEKFNLVEESMYFSICLDESTDQSNIAQLLIYVRTTSKDFFIKEELFDVCSLHGTIKEKDIYDAVKKSVDKIVGIRKCSDELTHFPSCEEILKEFKEQDKVVAVFDCSFEIQEVIEEFDIRFIEVEDLKRSILLFSNLLCVKIEEQEPRVQLELCDLQTDPFFQTRQEKGPDFFKLLSEDRFHNLQDFRLKMTSMFRSTYKCESMFSTMRVIKNKNRSSLTDTSLCHFLRLSTTGLAVDIQLLDAAERPQSSH
ncbi:hypothetical protein PR048_012061 [Dryococelus australis]|uniref:Uncharacterized protein n=1 Tax=Dryococelus australis TaxID=614101 RepID=A0ABQ9HNA2_9NEOP|nr:hypothetical protein PR048_012061 [Dryococelus australis]